MLPLAASCGQKAQHPNIVFFLVDDMGWADSQVAYGDEVYPFNQRFNTPNMLRVAEQGVVMSNAYACPVSTPTRTSLMTGMNAAHSRITNWTAMTKDTPSDASGGANALMGGVTDMSGESIQRADWNLNGITPVDGVANAQYATPMVQLLKDAGYFTVHVGKAHWAAQGTPGASPYNMGFVVNVAGQVAGLPRSYQSEDNYGNTKELWQHSAVMNLSEYYGTGTHLTEALTREALKTLDYPIAHKQPFYLYMAHYATHTPIQPDERFAQKYRDAGMDEGQARYASMVEGVDKSLGDILDYLEEKGVADNTIIIFMTDNGGNSENTQKGGVRFHHNEPLRNGKGSCYEGGVRVPLAFVWKGKIYPGTKISNPVICEDLFPTILDFAGVKNYKVAQAVDGLDLVKLLEKGSKESSLKGGEAVTVPASAAGVDPEREIIVHYPHKWKPYDLEDIDYLSAMRKGDWKLVYRMADRRVELYNIKEDIGEVNDLSAQNPEKAAELSKILSDRLRQWNSPMPVYGSTGERLPLPDEL